MERHYRTRHNAAMFALRTLFLTLICSLSQPVLAWNCQGHRLIAAIAWQQLEPAHQRALHTLLLDHPDLPRWQSRKGVESAFDVFVEAACWPDDIRNDPRYYDERHEAPTPPIEGLVDHASHRDWHYLDFDRAGNPVKGQLLSRLSELVAALETTGNTARQIWALPWLLHLVGDLHQPMHVGHTEDAGGNEIMLEQPESRGQPFVTLHRFWDELPGTRLQRGQHLADRAAALTRRYPEIGAASPEAWLKETRSLLELAYPNEDGSLLKIVDSAFRERSKALAERQLARAGQRLAHLLSSAPQGGAGFHVKRQSPQR